MQPFALVSQHLAIEIEEPLIETIYMRALNGFHLNGLKAVEAVARLGSLAAAAYELGVSPGAVSQQVIRIEASIGRPLFARMAGGLVPLAGAEVFFRRLHDGFRALDGAVDTLTERAQRRLTVSVAPVFAAKWLVPRLGRFQSLHPDTQLLIDATVALVDLDRSDVDIAIRVGAGPWRGVRAEALIEQEVFPVCSPALAERLNDPSDLASVPVVRDANSVLSWDLWLAPLGLSEAMLGQGPSYSDAALCLDAAISGQGVFLAWPTLAADAIAEGRLIRPFPTVARTGQSYWLITSPKRRMSTQARLFGEWLKQELGTSTQSD
jgi:DNA-binding transcriptional LysR family regulator